MAREQIRDCRWKHHQRPRRLRAAMLRSAGARRTDRGASAARDGAEPILSGADRIVCVTLVLVLGFRPQLRLKLSRGIDTTPLFHGYCLADLERPGARA